MKRKRYSYPTNLIRPTHPTVLFIVGPTGSGKSEAALELAKSLKGEIVSADSMQVYKGMDIGTAKPSAVERRRVPHHMIDIRRPSQSYSVYDYLEEALPVIEGILRKGRLPVVVGGSGLYVRTLIRGIEGHPGADRKIRSGLEKAAKLKGIQSLYRRLQKADPARAAEINPGDKKRIIRALEIIRARGRKKGAEKCKAVPGLRDAGYGVQILGIGRERAFLYERINARVEKMFRQGLVNEVRRLMKLRLSKTAKQAVGYKELMEALKAKKPASESMAKIKQNSRRYAKRQMTWFKREEGIRWLEWPPAESRQKYSQRMIALLSQIREGC